MEITKNMEEFILFWGEMGARWGVNRSVAQIHALLYLSDKPLPADEIQEILKIARSNVSNSLKELQSWKLVHLSHVMGDRRDHFEAIQEPWDMVMAIAEGRKVREIDPALEMLRKCSEKLEGDKATPDDVKKKIENMHKFLEESNRWYQDMLTVPRPVLKALMKLGAKVVKIIK
ncbi:MAG: MarR family transcriptional regulator [Rickettsiales bacterium]